MVFIVTISAQEISFTAQAPKAVRAGEQFQITYTLNVDADNFTPPDFGEFRYMGGPSTGSSTSVSFVNGRTTRTSSYTFTYLLQAGQKEGSFTIPPATATYKKSQIQSNAATITVVAQSSQQGSSGTQGSSSGSPGQAQSTGEDIFVRLEFDKKTAYVGEQITAWIKLYTKLNISGIDQFKGPDFVGFYQQDIDLPPLTSLEAEKVGNDIYHTGLLKKVILTPQRSGDMKIEPFDMLVEVQKQTRRRPQSMFDEFFGSPFERARVNLRSNAPVLKIKPLPDGQPANFNGIVGNFKIDGTVSSTDIATNDAVTFRIIVSGNGNIKLIDKVTSVFPPALDVFDPVKKVQADPQGKSGKVIFEYTAIPRHAGAFEIPPFSMAFFDPQAGVYKTISTQAFNINVQKSEGDTSSLVVSNLAKEEVELLGSDIRYIETKTRLVPKSNFIAGSFWFLLLYGILIIIALVILFVRREQIRRTANAVRYRNRKAGKNASKRLRKAFSHMKVDNKVGFYDELEQAFWHYFSDKLNIPFSELSAERIRQEFEARNTPEQLTSEFFGVIDMCQYARFAPGSSGEKMNDLYAQSVNIINKLDQSL